MADSVNGYPGSLKGIREAREELEILELHMLEKALRSDDPRSYVEAYKYIGNNSKKGVNDLKSFGFSPLNDYYTGQGFKYKPYGLSNDLLRNMSSTPQIKSIINTRIEQAADFNEFTNDVNKSGWTLIKERGLFDNKEQELTDADKREIEALVKFLQNGGASGQWAFEGWETFCRKLFEDSWAIDQGVFEIAVDRMGRPHTFDVYDGTTFYLADHRVLNQQDRERLEAYEVNGHIPKYVQVFQGKVYHEYYPWELCFGIRNANSSIKLNGYGLSENEVLIQVITWMLNSNQYNGNFFKQGSNPKGILNFKDNIDPAQLDNFKQGWNNTLSGVRNSHKISAISGGEVEWINMQVNNRDMEFHKWNEFLTVLSCTVFRIDPDEVGFHLEGSSGMFGQDGQKERLRHSREKGFEPFMKFWQRKFNKYLVGPLTGGKYKFVYTGLEPEDEEATLKRDIDVLANGGMSVQDFFLKYSKREVDLNKDILLNQIALQYMQMSQFGSPESNAAVDSDAGEPNPFADKDNPFNKGYMNYMENFIDGLNK